MPEIDQESRYRRLVQTSVVNFLQFGDEYLFLRRDSRKRIDPGRLNGIGGRREPGEDYGHAAIRETYEETGYQVTLEDLSLAAVITLEGGYAEDWVMCIFRIKVPTKEIPLGNITEDGELMWIHKDQVLDSGHKLVDDLNFFWKEITSSRKILFLNAVINNQEKVSEISQSSIARS